MKKKLLLHPKRRSPPDRVVGRSNNNANAQGGVSYANANNDSANVNANNGSRLDYNQRNLIDKKRSGRVPTAESRRTNHSNSGHSVSGKLKKTSLGRVW